MRKASQVSALAAILERVGAVKHPVATEMRGDVARLHAAAAALDNVRNNRSPLDTEAAHALKLAKQARRFDPQITAVINAAMERHRSASDNLRKRIDEKVNFKIDPDDAREIRAVFRSMKHAERVEALEKLLKNGRGPELHAIVSGTELTTGIDDKMRLAFRDSYVAKHAAEEMAEREALQEDLDSLLAATRAAGDFVKELTDPGKLASIERADAEANAAGEAFDQVFAAQ